VIAWAASVAFVPALHTLNLGQASGLLLLGVTGFLYGALHRRDFLAGLFLALTTIKPHVVYLLGIAVLWWVIRERRWKVLAGAAAPLLVAIGLLALRWPAALTGYRAALAHPPLNYRTPTLGGVLRLWIAPGDARIQLLVPMAVALAFLAWLVARRPALDWREALAPILLVSVATAAYGYTFDQVVLLVPYLGVVARITDETVLRRERGLLLAGLVLIDGLMAVQGLLRMDYWLSFWAPWALLIVYDRCRHHGSRRNSAVLAG
jgi:hypothetical protein